MEKEESGRNGLMGRAAAARYLGVSVRTLTRYTTRGILVPQDRIAGRWYYRAADLDRLRGHVGSDVNTSSVAVEALQTAQRAEAMAKDIMQMLGMDRPHMDSTMEGIRRDYQRACTILRRKLIVREDEQLRWAQQLSTVTDAYFTLTALHTGDPRPWSVYNRLLQLFLETAAPGSVLHIAITQAVVGVRQAAYITVTGNQDPYLNQDVVKASFLGRVRNGLRLLAEWNVNPDTRGLRLIPIEDPDPESLSSE